MFKTLHGKSDSIYQFVYNNVYIYFLWGKNSSSLLIILDNCDNR